MKSVLILFAHPKYEQSRTNKALVEKVRNMEGVTLHDLYEQYPDFNIDREFEKKLLTQHDIIIWHHHLTLLRKDRWVIRLLPTPIRILIVL